MAASNNNKKKKEKRKILSYTSSLYSRRQAALYIPLKRSLRERERGVGDYYVTAAYISTSCLTSKRHKKKKVNMCSQGLFIVTLLCWYLHWDLDILFFLEEVGCSEKFEVFENCWDFFQVFTYLFDVRVCSLTSSSRTPFYLYIYTHCYSNRKLHIVTEIIRIDVPSHNWCLKQYTDKQNFLLNFRIIILRIHFLWDLILFFRRHYRAISLV